MAPLHAVTSEVELLQAIFTFNLLYEGTVLNFRNRFGAVMVIAGENSKPKGLNPAKLFLSFLKVLHQGKSPFMRKASVSKADGLNQCQSP